MKLPNQNREGIDFRKLEEFGDPSKVHYVHVQNGNKKIDFYDVNFSLMLHNAKTFGLINKVNNIACILDLKTMKVLRKKENLIPNQFVVAYDKIFEFTQKSKKEVNLRVTDFDESNEKEYKLKGFTLTEGLTLVPMSKTVVMVID